MKVALILAGHMRDWETCFPIIKKEILNKYDPDVYISSFDHNLDNIRQYEHDGIEYIDNREHETESIDIKKVLDCYNPKKYIFRINNYELDFQFNNIVTERIPREWAKRNIQSWETVYHSLQIIDLNEYDIIIRTRPDISIRNLNLIQNENLVFPDLCIDPGPCTINEGLHPNFVYGNPKYMKKYLEIYTKLQDMHSKGMTDISVKEMTLRDYVNNYIGIENIAIDENIEWKYDDTEWSNNLKKAHELILLDNPQGWFNMNEINQEEYDSIMKAIEMDALIPDDAYDDQDVELL